MRSLHDGTAHGRCTTGGGGVAGAPVSMIVALRSDAYRNERETGKNAGEAKRH
jgi:hypothetical protein